MSDSAKFKMTSRKEGIDPVVMAFTRGIVMVGDVAWAVKGIAAPDLISLLMIVSDDELLCSSRAYALLNEDKAGIPGIDEVTK